MNTYHFKLTFINDEESTVQGKAESMSSAWAKVIEGYESLQKVELLKVDREITEEEYMRECEQAYRESLRKGD